MWAIPATAIVMLLFTKVWKQKLYTFIVRSLFFWTLVTACYVQFIEYNIWPLFFLMIPIQVALILTIAINDKLKISLRLLPAAAASAAAASAGKSAAAKPRIRRGMFMRRHLGILQSPV